MALAAGDKLGPYEIVGLIGSGGMGEVYRGRDTRLNRDVAIKISKEQFSERFAREAQAIAALNHSNICTLYDVGPNYLVMEYVEGHDLRGPMEFDDALPILRQLIDGIEAAHEKNIIHRDLKPANIKITADGVVKILDFGLARLDAVSAPGGSDPEHSPTVSMAATVAGAILGTAAYMSPEQAKGRTADRRADIWAFGVIVYEMFTGKRLFRGESAVEILGAVLNKDPDISLAPPRAHKLLRWCLESDRKQRLQAIGDARRLLSEPEETAVQLAPRSRLRWLWPAVAALFAVIALLAWFRPRPQAAEALQNIALTIAPPSATGILPVIHNDGSPELSPDGSAVLYHSATDALLLRRLDAVTPQPVLGVMDKVNPASWASDSKAIIFATSTNLKRMRLPDGAPDTLASINEPLHGFSEAADGVILFAGVSRLYAFKPGEDVKPIETLNDARRGNYRWPEFLPGGRDFLVEHESADGSGNTIYLATLGQGKMLNPVVLMKNQTMARYTPSRGGRVLFVRNDNLYAQKLNRETRKLEGDPELLEQGVASTPEWGLAHFSVSRAGSVAWRPGRATSSQLIIFDRAGKQIGSAGPAGAYRALRLSPDGTRLLADGAFLLEPNQPGSLRVIEGELLGATWSTDNAHLLLPHDSRILSHPLGGGPDREVAKAPGIARVEDVSQDGKWALYSRGAMTDAFYAARLDGADSDNKPVIHTGAVIMNPRFSPDARWIAYAELAADNVSSIYLQPFPVPGLRRQISMNGNHPIWRKDGKEIFYLTDDSVWSARVDAAGGQLHISAPQMLFRAGPIAPGLTDVNQADISGDGSRFYIPLTVAQPDSGVIHIRLGTVN